MIFPDFPEEMQAEKPPVLFFFSFKELPEQGIYLLFLVQNEAVDQAITQKKFALIKTLELQKGVCYLVILWRECLERNDITSSFPTAPTPLSLKLVQESGGKSYL